MIIVPNFTQFLQKHIKSHTKHYVLEAIEGEDLGPKFFLGWFLGVMEGLTRGGYFPYSIFDPSAIDPTGHTKICSNFSL